MIASGAPNTPLTGNHSVVRSGTANGQSEQQSTRTRSCSWGQRKLDEWCLKFKGPDIALMQAAKHNNTQLISRIIDQNPSSINLCLKKKNENPAIQAAVRGNNEALQLLINLGASPDTLLASESYFPLRDFKPVDYSPADFTSKTMNVLLNNQGTDLNQSNHVYDLDRSILVTPTELVNSQVSAKNRSKISVLLASDARTRIHTKIDFLHCGPFKNSFNIEFPPDSSFRTTSEGRIPVSLIGQAILLNNAELARELLGRPDLDPGKPEGTAENLLTIFMHKLSNGVFFNLGNPLRQKIITSETFCRQILDSDSLIFKRQLLELLTMDFNIRNYPPSNAEFNQLDFYQLNDRIQQELSPPSYESIVQET
ncbi:ankyrin repeat domain-containing protein [Endozoicomonas sp. ONNA2]|uniref:ankyrin repeat domain-containing protein n=1 Tax=Endozoicomonas sp. ONNA2 TaxID=2828741 RepID=UPI0021493BCF|nr:ankyrin repeat domain-containing protein [Endozoicomonas sp. ONNA2]